MGAGEGRRGTRAARSGSSVTGAAVASAQAPGWSKHPARLHPPPNPTPPPSSPPPSPPRHPMAPHQQSQRSARDSVGPHPSLCATALSPSRGQGRPLAPLKPCSGWAPAPRGHLSRCLCLTHLAFPSAQGSQGLMPSTSARPSLLVLCSAPHPTPTTPPTASRPQACRLHTPRRVALSACGPPGAPTPGLSVHRSSPQDAVQVGLPVRVTVRLPLQTQTLRSHRVILVILVSGPWAQPAGLSPLTLANTAKHAGP